MEFFPDLQVKKYTIEGIKEAIKISTTDNPSNRKLWLNKLSTFIKSKDFYNEVKENNASKSIREVSKELEKTSITTIPIIVRSSGVSEDSYENSQAGKFDSIVKGSEDIVQTYLNVLASGYRSDVCGNNVPEPMAIILQQCIDCRLGGVAMSYTSLDNNTIQINTAPGQPKTSIAGYYGVTPDSYTINRESDTLKTTINSGDISHMHILAENSERTGFEEKK